jgi:acyl-CoA synthetase (AMP-forming)/AMP-acid ligase II
MHIFEKPDNLVELIENSVEKYPDNAMFGTKNKDGEYEWVTYREVGERIDNLRGGLSQAGIEKGDAVGIIASNRTEWAIAAFATFGLGGRYIPMYEKELVKIWKHIINDGGIKLLLVATQEIYDQIEAMRDELPGLEKVYLIEGEGKTPCPAWKKWGRQPGRFHTPQTRRYRRIDLYIGHHRQPQGGASFPRQFYQQCPCRIQGFSGLNEKTGGFPSFPGPILSDRPASFIFSPILAVRWDLWKM